ncbi:ATP-binding protein [Desulfoferrobacter suflitae]|uniref:ATP-binding protein n=1 Tax=Desulfoferrobacter suflitae TaxID=2865782 RepID=UPI0021640282|nr:ATP-binding protein [Desulfoferrobacter suflitae]MCK8601659.1 ATP-binding protein [Desulfoferrobacter suflitae]
MDTLRLPAKMEHLDRFRSYVLDKAAHWGLDDDLLFKIELALEELIVNVIHYAYAEHDHGEVEVGCSLVNDSILHLCIQDWGKPFDPLARPDPDTTQGINERGVGGLGIHLVRRMADQVTYQREQGCNILNLYFQIPKECLLPIEN